MAVIKEGAKAPAFKGADQHGKTVSIADFKGQKLVLYFYPKDDTPGCTAQACNLRDNYADLQAKGYAILGVSMDSAASHNKFIEKYTLPFPLLADTERKVIDAFGVWGPKKFMGKEYDGIHRTTFVIDEAGTITHIFDKPKTKEHGIEILDL